MYLKELTSKIEALKELTPDERIGIIDELEKVSLELSSLFDALNRVPDAEPEDQGTQNLRDAYVDSLLAKRAARAGK